MHLLGKKSLFDLHIILNEQFINIKTKQLSLLLLLSLYSATHDFTHAFSRKGHNACHHYYKGKHNNVCGTDVVSKTDNFMTLSDWC